MATFLAHEMQLSLQKKKQVIKKGKGKGKGKRGTLDAETEESTETTEVIQHHC